MTPYTVDTKLQIYIDTIFVIRKNVILISVIRDSLLTFTSAAALAQFYATQMQRLFEGGAYLKIGRDKGIFSLNLMVFFLSVQIFCFTSGVFTQIRSFCPFNVALA